MDTIYHYTDASGILGIVRGKIWLSHIDYLNDASEYNYGQEIYFRAIKELVDDVSFNPEVRACAKGSLAEMPSVRAFISKGVFVASFSGSLDDLGQWRGYTGTGARYCIGFSRSALEKLAEENELQLLPVAYGTTDSIKRIQAEYANGYSAAIREFEESREAARARGTTTGGSIVLGRHGQTQLQWLTIARAAAWCKDPAFEGENEWRLATSIRGGRGELDELRIRHRAGRSFLIPHLELDIGDSPSPIVSVMTGPSAHPKLSRESVRMLLRANKLGHVDVALSGIPFRDW